MLKNLFALGIDQRVNFAFVFLQKILDLILGAFNVVFRKT